MQDGIAKGQAMKRNFFWRGIILSGLLLGLGWSNLWAQPANDQFANRIFLSGTNVVTTGDNYGATLELGEPVQAGVDGGASVWWTWTAPISGIVTITTGGSGFDTMLSVYRGETVESLISVAFNDDEDYGAGITTSKVTFETAANVTYEISVDGYNGVAGPVRLAVQVGPAPPLPPAPTWALPDLNGTIVRSTNYAGKVVILDFWATWCGPCKNGMPDLVALQEKYGKDGLVIVGADVSWSGEGATTVRNFLATWTPTVNYQVVMSTTSFESALGGIAAIPTTFVIDRRNLLRKKFVGTQSYTTLENVILPLLYRDPCLTCERTGRDMTFRWPANVLAYGLEAATSLEAADWSPWLEAPVTSNGTNTLRISMTNAARFFRLRTAQ